MVTSRARPGREPPPDHLLIMADDIRQELEGAVRSNTESGPVVRLAILWVVILEHCTTEIAYHGP